MRRCTNVLKVEKILTAAAGADATTSAFFVVSFVLALDGAGSWEILETGFMPDGPGLA
jgi:hypothetical protein